MDWDWSLCHPLYDVEDVMEVARVMLRAEPDSPFVVDEGYFRQCLTLASTYQVFDKTREFVAICRDMDGKLLGYCWYDRGGYTTYSREEISNAKFHHVDLSLPVKTRVRLINEMIDQHILWANKNGIPVICSTSIREENDGFMKIHKKRGFTVRGSYAWVRTEEAIRCLTNQ